MCKNYKCKFAHPLPDTALTANNQYFDGALHENEKYSAGKGDFALGDKFSELYSLK